ncbi:MAG: universal stress protein [Leptospirillia bacterium]
MYQTILVSIDFSEPAEAAWRHAVALAKAHGSRLVVVYVAEPVLSRYGVVGLIPSVKELEEEHDTASRLRLKELAEGGEADGLTVEHKVVSGKPWEEIIRLAAETSADLVVLGTHGRTGISHNAIGSTAERVVQRAGCPVLVVRPTKPAA